MGTRFAASVESNAADEFKELYLKAQAGDIVRIDSPVGYPGQSLRNPFAIKDLEGKSERPTVCQKCLKSCSQKFCLINSLIRAQQGDVETGLIFAGESVTRINDILPVEEIFRRLLTEIDQCEG